MENLSENLAKSFQLPGAQDIEKWGKIERDLKKETIQAITAVKALNFWTIELPKLWNAPDKTADYEKFRAYLLTIDDGQKKALMDAIRSSFVVLNKRYSDLASINPEKRTQLEESEMNQILDVVGPIYAITGGHSYSAKPNDSLDSFFQALIPDRSSIFQALVQRGLVK